MSELMLTMRGAASGDNGEPVDSCDNVTLWDAGDLMVLSQWSEAWGTREQNEVHINLRQLAQLVAAKGYRLEPIDLSPAVPCALAA